MPNNELNSKHEWREMMTEEEQHFCFFNQTEFRDKFEEMEKIRNTIKKYKYEAGAGVRLANDSGEAILEDDTDVIESVYENYSH